MITASLKNFRTSPRKVRLVANLIRGKSASDALNILKFVSKGATSPLSALLLSAIANAKNNYQMGSEGLIVKEIRVDSGIVLKRSMPRARGSAFPIKKRTSHVLLVLAPAPEKKAKKAKFIKPAASAKSK
ncbi:MAG: hypothetical protein RIT04_102 [Candidatus Parcubacteria bacterium]|jgi:large subunit ribosomal protein L22